MDIIFFFIGIFLLIKGTVPISQNMRISSLGGRILGAVLMIPVIYHFSWFLGIGLPQPYEGLILYGGIAIVAILVSRSYKEPIPTGEITGRKTPTIAWVGLFILVVFLAGIAYSLYNARNENIRAGQDISNILNSKAN